jgi:glycerol uptake facilitator-like aquaporin
MFKELSVCIAREQEPCPVAAPRRIALVELVATAGLALSTAIAVTAVSIGIARADVLGTVAKGDSAPFAIALFIGLLFAAMGGLTAIVVANPRED